MKKLLTLLFLLALAGSADAYKQAVGTYPGTGIAQTIDISDTSDQDDFEPNACIVKGVAAVDSVMRIEGMPATESHQIDGSGRVTTGILDFVSNGFTIGTGATVNTNLTTYYYVCWATDASNDFSYGMYTGIAAGNNRSIVISPAFAPEAVIIIEDAAGSVKWRGANSHTGDTTSTISNTADGANRIDQFNADGFRVDAALNADGIDHFYIAFKAGVSTVKSGSYTSDTGTCADDCAVTGLGYQPQFMLMKGAGTQVAIYKFSPQPAAQTCQAASTGSCTATDNIKSFDADGFTYGSGASVNTNGVLYHWLATREAAAAGTAFGPLRRRGL